MSIDLSLFLRIPEYEKLYMINQLGEVYSLVNQKLLKPRILSNQKSYVVLNKNGKQKSKQVEKLILLTFTPRPKYEVLTIKKRGFRVTFIALEKPVKITPKKSKWGAL